MKLAPGLASPLRTAAIGHSGSGVRVVENREETIVTHGQQAGDQLDHAAAGTQVAEITLRGHDGQRRPAGGENFSNRPGFLDVAGAGAQAVGVQVADVVHAGPRRVQ